MDTSMFRSLLNIEKSKADQKKEYLQQAGDQKRQALDPQWQSMQLTEDQILDADTIKGANGEYYRLGGDQGYFADAFETKDKSYDDRPDVEQEHKRAYARHYGLDVEDVSREDLLREGRNQRNEFINGLRENQNEDGTFNLEFQPRGEMTEDGRQLANFRAPGGQDMTQQLSSYGQNANFWSKHNYQGILDSFKNPEDAERAKQERLAQSSRGILKWGKDTAINIAGTAGGLVADAADLVADVTTAPLRYGLDAIRQKTADNPETAKLFEAADSYLDMLRPGETLNKGIDWVKDKTLSDETKAKNAARQRYMETHSKDAENRIQGYMRNGDNRFVAEAKNLVDETVFMGKMIKNDPMMAIDAAFESIPYLYGIAAAGRKGAAAGIAKINKRVEDDLARTFKDKGLDMKVTQEMVEKHISRNPELMKEAERMATRYGVNTGAVLEGLGAGQEASQRVKEMSHEELMENERYRNLVEGGMSPSAAQHFMANAARGTAFLMSAVISKGASHITGVGRFESNILNDFSKAKLKGMSPSKIFAELGGKGIAGATVRGTGRIAGRTLQEMPEEYLQEGGSALATNVGTSIATGDTGAYTKGVGQQATLGAAAGGVTGGGLQVTKSTISGARKGAEKFKGVTDKAKELGGKVKDTAAEFNAAARKPGGLDAQREAVVKEAATKTSAPDYDPEVELHNSLKEVKKNPFQYKAAEEHFYKLREKVQQQAGELQKKHGDGWAETEEGTALLGDFAANKYAIEEAAEKAAAKIGEAVQPIIEDVVSSDTVKESDAEQLMTAASLGALSQEAVDRIDETKSQEHADLKSELQDMLRIDKAMGNIRAREQESIDKEKDPARKLTKEQVADEKLGAGINQAGRKGLEKHRQDISDIIKKKPSPKRQQAFESARNELAEFIDGQKQKIANARRAAEQYKNGELTKDDRYELTPHSNEQYMPQYAERVANMLEAEQADLETILEGLDSIAKTKGYSVGSAAPQQETQGETSPETKPEKKPKPAKTPEASAKPKTEPAKKQETKQEEPPPWVNEAPPITEEAPTGSVESATESPPAQGKPKTQAKPAEGQKPAPARSFEQKVEAELQARGLPAQKAKEVAARTTLEQTPEKKKELKKWQNIANTWANQVGLPLPIRLVSTQDFIDNIADDSLNSKGTSFGHNLKTEDMKTLDVYVAPDLSPEEFAETLAHEIGHHIETRLLENASEATRQSIRSDFDAWMEARKEQTPKKKALENLPWNLAQAFDKELSEKDFAAQQDYWLDFSEWFANQTAKWMLTETLPNETIAKQELSSTDKFFKNLADKFKKLITALNGEKAKPENVHKFLRDQFNANINPKQFAKYDEKTKLHDVQIPVYNGEEGMQMSAYNAALELNNRLQSLADARDFIEHNCG